MNIPAYLKLFYKSTYLPVHYYRKENCLLNIPLENEAFDFLEPFFHTLTSSDQNMNYVISDNFLYFGIVRNFATGEDIILGPVSSVPVKPQALSQIMAECSISSEHYDNVRRYFQETPVFSHDQFLHFLAILNASLNQQVIDPLQYFNYNTKKTVNMFYKKTSASFYRLQEEEISHNSYQFEQQLYHYVEDGNTEALKKLLQRGNHLITGAIGENLLRQKKNLFIASITLATRHSIAGGLDIETAYRLSDAYILKAEQIQEIKAIQQLFYTSLMDFTRRVAANRIPPGISPDINKCIQFISARTNHPISVKDVANAVGKSPSYLSKKFKKELGIPLSDFIMRRKLEEGKIQLAYTDKSISEISEYLCFSSQSYFQNTFKKIFHMTPAEYRKSMQ